MKNGTLKHVIGDATVPQISREKEIVIIPHCCNNENKWGAGFVVALSRKWEEPEKTYRNFCNDNKDLPILGKVCYAKINDFFVVANMIGQDGVVSTDNRKPIKYWALISCMREVAGYIKMIQSQTSNPVVIHCPMFGSDLACGKWDVIIELIKETWVENGIDVVVYEFAG